MSEWTQARLSGVAEVRPSNVDKRTVAGEYSVRLCNYMDVYTRDYITDDIQFMEASASAAELQRFRIDRGDVLVTKDSETPDDIGISAVVLDDIRDLVCGYHLALLKPDRQRLDPVYLSKQLASAETARYFACRANGSTRYGLSFGVLAATPIRLAPVAQQHRIAKILSTLDEAIEQTEALIAKTQQIKAGLMHDLFTRGITPDGQLRPPRSEAPHLYKESALGWIPEEWECATFEQLLTKRVLSDVQDGNHGELHPKKEDFVPEGIPFLMAKDLAGGEIDFSGCYKIAPAQYRRLRIGFATEGDVLLSHKGSIGETAVIPAGRREVMLTPQVTYYRVNSTRLSRDFLNFWMRSETFQRRLKLLAAQSTRDYVGITAQKRSLYAVLPTEPEQERVVAFAGGVAWRLRTEAEMAQELRALKAGLMQDLLTGRVRVPVADAPGAASAG